MVSGDIICYVIIVIFYEDFLIEINEFNNYLMCSGFLLILMDDEGNVYEFGINMFGFVSV